MREDMGIDLNDKPRMLIIGMLVGAIALFLVSMLAGALFMHIRGRSAGASENNSVNEVVEIIETEADDRVSAETTEDETVTETVSGETTGAESTEIQPEPQDIVAGQLFNEVNETVTAKDATNLRNVPSQGEESRVMVTLYNGQAATRTAVSDSGWSRVVYQGETYYAVSSLLTTDLTAKPEPTPVPDDGINTEFTACDEAVSPKIEVNLRNIPSVTNAESQVIATVKYGEVFRRTGYNEDLGWSRVEYNGQTLYCVSSYIYIYEEPTE